jgi:hypothetical protein
MGDGKVAGTAIRDNIDATFVRSAASSFRTSIPVMIERRSIAAPADFERCVLLVRRLEGDAQIRASYFGVGLLPILPRPRKYTHVTDWLADFPRLAITSRTGEKTLTAEIGLRRLTPNTAADHCSRCRTSGVLRTQTLDGNLACEAHL